MTIPTGKMFKYVAAERLDGLLRTEKIRFTQPNAFNDPFEMPAFRAAEVQSASSTLLRELSATATAPGAQGARISETAVADPLAVPGSASQLPINPWAMRELEVLALGRLAEEWVVAEAHRAAVIERLHELETCYGILSLTTNPHNLLMWAHYADNHRGAVVAIDIDHPEFAIHGRCGPNVEERRSVQYTGRRPALDPGEQVSLDQLFTKDDCWEDEEEFRIIRRISAEPPPTFEKAEEGAVIYLYPLPHACVQSITFGCRFFQNRGEVIQRVKEALAALGEIPLWQADLDPGAFKLTFGAIDRERIGEHKKGFEPAMSESERSPKTSMAPPTSTW